MNKFQVGVIGYGWAATAHIAALNATGRAQVVAVYSSRSLDDAELTASTVRKSRVTGRSPSSSHIRGSTSSISQATHGDMPDQAVAAAEAGRRVVLEKPAALSLADLRRIEAAVGKAGVKFCICFVSLVESFSRDQGDPRQGVAGNTPLRRSWITAVGIGPWYGQFRWNISRPRGRVRPAHRGDVTRSTLCSSAWEGRSRKS